MTFVVDCVLLALLASVGVAVSRTRDLLVAVVLFSIYSLLCAALFTLLAAPDVAITEAAVGAGFSTILMLAAISAVGRTERRRRRPPFVAAAVVLTVAGCLAFGLAHAPAFGRADAAPHTHVAPFYLHDTPAAIGIPNVVTAVLASYRAFDTLGEVTVVFTAGIAVLALLSRRSRRPPERRATVPPRTSTTRLLIEQDHAVPRVVGKLLLPAILMYALYVQFHGELGPGGGFAAGVILATGFALFALLSGPRRARVAAPMRIVEAVAALGLLTFLGVGIATVVLGGDFLDYDVLAADPRTGQQLGILIVEIGVGMTVGAVMIALFSKFVVAAARHRTG